VTLDLRLFAAAAAVCDLFGGDGWPRVEVMTDPGDSAVRAVLPLPDDDAEAVRVLRRVLRGEP